MHKVELKPINPRIKELNAFPKKGTDGAAGYDVRYIGENTLTLNPGDRVKVPLGFAIHIGNPDIAAILMPRSGLGSKGLRLANTIGLIDSDYQGEIAAVIEWHPLDKNDDLTSLTIEPGDRFIQMVFLPIVSTDLGEVFEFTSSTQRGEGGYGSTGVK